MSEKWADRVRAFSIGWLCGSFAIAIVVWAVR